MMLNVRIWEEGGSGTVDAPLDSGAWWGFWSSEGSVEKASAVLWQISQKSEATSWI